MQSRNFLQYFVISLKGIAMGAADAVPGVSGGTIAFISGIYEELVNTISGVNFVFDNHSKERRFCSLLETTQWKFPIGFTLRYSCELHFLYAPG